MIVFDYTIGGTVVLELDAESVDPAVVAVSAAMRRLNHDRSEFKDGSPSVPMTITPRAAAGNNPAGWHVVLSAVASAALEPGYYGANAWLSAGEPFATERVILHLRRAA
jgi:hypothetical protein